MDTTSGSNVADVKRAVFFLVLFVAASVTELGAFIVDVPLTHLIVKPLIMLSLIGYYLSLSPGRSMTFVRALFFCWTGDVLLLFQAQGEIFFLLGLVAFLLGHVLYVVSYRQMRWPDLSNELLPKQKILYSLPVILAATGLLAVLFPSLGNLKIPVMAYAFVLMLMVMTSVFRYGRTTSTSFWMVFSGALLFMVSDSVLALNKFYSSIPFSSIMIMLTYVAAQYLIVSGAVRHAVRE